LKTPFSKQARMFQPPENGKGLKQEDNSYTVPGISGISPALPYPPKGICKINNKINIARNLLV
jgi:hypothetical protein